MRENKNARVLMDNLDSEVDWPRTSPYSRRRTSLARLDLRKSLITPNQLISNGHGAMAPSATRDHHQLRVNRLPNRGVVAREISVSFLVGYPKWKVEMHCSGKFPLAKMLRFKCFPVGLKRYK